MAIDSVDEGVAFGGVAYTNYMQYLQSILLQPIQNTGTAQGTGDSSGIGTTGGSAGGGQNHAFVNSVMVTLSQLGITQNPKAGATPAATSAANNGSDQQALHTFIHSLFHALDQNTQGTPPPAGGSAPSPANLAADLQNLIQSITLNTGGIAGLDSLLGNDFLNMIQTVQSNNSSSTSVSQTASQTTLQTFLQALIQNLPNQQQGTDELGNLVNTLV
ncbi:hypothetical protein [Candidatus Magnetominusculus dajiuhuensis]|uniref:hypothetical protein n=1 Tax=Candidatus Magnetominusculus dajiuhuensis TaxID=3137712 RepID=UPI003B430AF5